MRSPSLGLQMMTAHGHCNDREKFLKIERFGGRIGKYGDENGNIGEIVGVNQNLGGDTKR